MINLNEIKSELKFYEIFIVYIVYFIVNIICFCMIFLMMNGNIPHLKSSVVHGSEPADPGTEDDGEVVDVREGGEVSVGGEDFILRHVETAGWDYLCL